jgi:hypothetical protein
MTAPEGMAELLGLVGIDGPWPVADVDETHACGLAIALGKIVRYVWAV